MTLAIGLSASRGVWIGADSGSTTESFTEVCSTPKIWRSNGWLVASAGNWRALEILRYDCEFPDPRGNHHKALCMDLNTDLGKAFDRNDFELMKNSDGDVVEGYGYHILCARDNKLFQIDFVGHVEQVKRSAIGVGTDYACGIIDASELGSAERRIKKALTETAKHYRVIVGPYLIEKA